MADGVDVLTIRDEFIARVLAQPEQSLSRLIAQLDALAPLPVMLLVFPPDGVPPLGTRASNCLRRTSITTFGELGGWSINRLLNIQNMGTTSAREIVTTLCSLALAIDPETGIDGTGLGMWATLVPCASMSPRTFVQFALSDIETPDAFVEACMGQAASPIGASFPELSPLSDLPLSLLSNPPPGIPPISTRPRRCLERCQVIRFSELLAYSPNEFLSVQNAGVKSLREILVTTFLLGTQVSKEELETHLTNSANSLLPSRQEPSVRDRTMLEMRLSGCTLDEIGRTYGLTRERVRQVLMRMGAPSGQELIARRNADRERRDSELRPLVVRAILENVGSNINHVAMDCSLPIREVTRLAPTEARKFLLPEEPRQNQAVRRWDEASILTALAVASRMATPLTVGRYSELVQSGLIDGPSAPLVYQRFGSWKRACELAGVTAGRALRDYNSVFSRLDLLTAIACYLMDPTTDGTLRGYDEWRSQTEPRPPSSALLRRHLGSWDEMRRELFSTIWSELQQADQLIPSQDQSFGQVDGN